MNRILSIIGAVVLFVSVPLASGHAAPSGRLEDANFNLRTELTKGMLEGAAQHRINILSDGIVFASRDDGMVANTGVAGFESLTYDHLARGAVVGLTYFSGFGIAPGFYRTYILLPKGAKQGTAYLLDEAGRTVLTATVDQTAGLSAKGKFTASVGWSYVTVDYHSANVSFSVTYRW